MRKEGDIMNEPAYENAHLMALLFDRETEITRLRLLLIRARKQLYENPQHAGLVADIDEELEHEDE